MLTDIQEEFIFPHSKKKKQSSPQSFSDRDPPAGIAKLTTGCIGSVVFTSNQD